jgi:hypothetical protein
VKLFAGNHAGNINNQQNNLIMSTKPKTPPNGANGANASAEPPTYRINPEVEAKIDAHIKDNPKYWDYLKAMPRERLERTVVLNEVRELDRQQRIREGVLKQINRNPEMKQAYELLVKNVPDDQKEDVIAQIGRTTRRAVARVQGQQQARGEAVGV